MRHPLLKKESSPTVAWGTSCLSHNCFKIWRFSSDLTQIRVVNLNLAMEPSRGPSLTFVLHNASVAAVPTEHPLS